MRFLRPWLPYPPIEKDGHEPAASVIEAIQPIIQEPHLWQES